MIRGAATASHQGRKAGVGNFQSCCATPDPERKFIITSRSDILQSAGPDLTKTLEPYTISIEIEDYGSERLEKVYDGIASDLTGHAHSLACDYRETALTSLQRPYEIDRFLVALSREDARKARKAGDIVSDSQIDAISGVIAAQIEPLGDDGVASAAIIWALLVAREAVQRDVFTKLLRCMRGVDSSVRPDVEGLIDFMIAGRNLRRDGACVSLYHPKVEEGLQRAIMRRKSEAEHVLSIAIDGLATMDDANEDWGIETGLAVCRAATKIDGIQLSLRPPTQARLDNHLESNTLGADRRFDFQRTLSDLARFGSEEHLPSRVARALIDGAPDSVVDIFGNWWRCPPLPEAEIVELRKDARTTPLIQRFVREVLPFSGTNYDPGRGQAASTACAQHWSFIPGTRWTLSQDRAAPTRISKRSWRAFVRMTRRILIAPLLGLLGLCRGRRLV